MVVKTQLSHTLLDIRPNQRQSMVRCASRAVRVDNGCSAPSVNAMSRPGNPSQRVSEQVKETLERNHRGRNSNFTGNVVRAAASMAARGTRAVGRGAGNLARDAAEGAIIAVKEVAARPEHS